MAPINTCKCPVDGEESEWTNMQRGGLFARVFMPRTTPSAEELFRIT